MIGSPETWIPTVEVQTPLSAAEKLNPFMKPSNSMKVRVVGKVSKSHGEPATGAAVPSPQPIAQNMVGEPAALSSSRRVCEASCGSKLIPKVAEPGVPRPEIYVRTRSWRQVVST